MIIPCKALGYKISAYIYRYLFFLCFVFGTCVIHGQQVIVPGSEAQMNEYNRLAKQKLDEFNYDESRHYLELALREKENALSYCFMCHINGMQKDWEEAALNGEKCVSLDPNIIPVYLDLFYAEYYARRWTQALEISGKVRQYNPDLDISNELAGIELAMENEGRSNTSVILLMLLVLTAFAVPIFIASKNKANYFSSNRDLRFSELLLAACSVSLALWMIFYAFSHWIWSFNPHVSAGDVTTIIAVSIFEHDGAESFVLYTMMFLNIAFTLLLTPWLLKTGTNKTRYLSVYAVLLLLSCYYFYKTGFYPPVVTFLGVGNIVIPLLLMTLCISVYFIYLRTRLIAFSIITLLCAYAALLSYSPPNHIDIEFILAPALRLLHGFKVPDIYFQYDLYMSLLAELWLKYNVQLDSFVYLGNISFFLFFIGAFVFGEKFFKTKGLSVVFMIALITTRVYAQGNDSLTLLQVTPMRLDLWLIVLLIVNKFGVRHWLTGIFLGLMILFHRNLGLIYTVAYLELLVIMYLIDIVPLFLSKKADLKSLSELFVKHLRSNLINLAILTVSVVLCFVLFHEFFSASARLYRKLGIGMLPISKMSFYWYVPLLFSSVATFLYLYRERLGSKYVTTGIFIVLLAISNSMYFFGRSHENNILNICGVIVFALFLLFDILIVLHAPNEQKQQAGNTSKRKFLTKSRAFMLLPVLFVLLTGYFYSDRIETKARTQYDNLLTGTFYYPLTTGAYDIASAKQLTNNSPKVYFLDFWTDFYYCYYSGIAPQGYYSPCSAWIYKKEFDDFMQSLLDDGYYIVYEQSFFNVYQEYVVNLNYNNIRQQNNLVAIKKEPAPLLLSTTESVAHIGINAQLGSSGIYRKPLNEKEALTIEMIIKPNSGQPANATVFTDLNKTDRMSGTVLQANGNVPGQYTFGIGNGGQDVKNLSFALDENKWNYLVIEVGTNSIRVYNNGKPIATTDIDKPFLNSGIPIYIGNSSEHNRMFDGIIREIKFSDGNLSENEITATAQRLAGSLPQ
ncbi:MAG: hypothetical protein JWQ38_2518 [Flavipsychrobacter sp.]|nr:hypothetical protein [Flavipsychrobacter sp.]